jgi:hypothetical protein
VATLRRTGIINVATAAIQAWGEMYRDSSALQTGVAFAHIGALVTSGGLAVTQDRAVLKVPPGDVAAREARLRELRGSHATVITGLAIVFASGLLFFLADLETFLTSKLFWAKIGFVAVLVVNGSLLLRAERRAELDPSSDPVWGTVRRHAWTSLSLWLLLTLAGTALVNVS